MAEVLLINPRSRRKSRKAKSRRSRKGKMPAGLARYWAAKRRGKKRVARRRNPVSYRAVTRRRRSNPDGFGRMFTGIVPMIQNAAIGAVGSIGVDLAMGQINRFLPTTLQVVPGTIGAGDAIKAVATVALGQLLSRPTRGMSKRMAQGALTVQADRIIRSFLPATITSQMGYAVPAVAVTQGSPRIGPNRVNTAMSAYTKPGVTPLLSAYTRAGAPSPLLSSARVRESIVR
jgi:hypothetical protein